MKLVEILSALLTPTIAIAGGIIAWLQWQTNERKRTQELFDRRYEFYKRALGAYEEFHSDKNGSTEPWEFDYFYTEAGFLFGDDIVDHLKNFGSNPKRNLAWFARPFSKYLRLR